MSTYGVVAAKPVWPFHDRQSGRATTRLRRIAGYSSGHRLYGLGRQIRVRFDDVECLSASSAQPRSQELCLALARIPRSLASTLEQLSQHGLQDAAVAVVVELHG